MINENELVTLLLAVGALVFILSNGAGLRRLPMAPLFVSAYGVLVLGWCFTVLEGFFWDTALNYLEHACYAASSCLLALWCWLVFSNRPQCS
ncbi:MAG: hypothetical protein JXB62_15810 [Pirellulales bacterium]|nr:hypothetical protein [Pirellulales bacterium]